jgi:hypothetical protein
MIEKTQYEIDNLSSVDSNLDPEVDDQTDWEYWGLQMALTGPAPISLVINFRIKVTIDTTQFINFILGFFNHISNIGIA